MPDSSSRRRAVEHQARLFEVVLAAIEAPPKLHGNIPALHRSIRRHRHALRRSSCHGRRMLRRSFRYGRPMLRRSIRRRRLRCNGVHPGLQGSTTGAIGAPPRLQWSSTAFAIEHRRGRNGAPPRLQWSFTAATNGAHPRSLELCRGCNGAPPRLQWSFTTTTMERGQGCNGAPPWLQ